MSTDIIGLMKIGNSPINLDDRYVTSKKFPPLILSGHWLKDGEAYLSNDGKTAMISLSGERMPSTVTGGPLMNDEYEFIDAHFHWGKENCNGSEHQINGTWFSMEAHVVHWNRKYFTFKESLKHKDGLAILAYFFLVTEKNVVGNPIFEKITDHLKNIVAPGSEVQIPANCLSWMREATHCPKYYTYLGTYDERREGRKLRIPYATWIIFPLMIPVSAGQVDEFRKLRNKKGRFIFQNCKEIEPPNGRRIFLVENNKQKM